MNSVTGPTRRPILDLATLAVYLFVLLHLTSCTPLGLSWLVEPKERIDVIVPEGYEGPVLIAYQIPDGITAEKKDNVWQYRLQDDGALLLRSDPLSGVGQLMFFYELNDGTLRPIPHSSCFDDIEYEGVVVCTGMMTEIHRGRNFRPNESFSIARLDTKRQWTPEDYDRLIDRYFDRLVLPEQE